MTNEEAKENARRARKWRAERLKAGCRHITIMLPAEAVGALDDIKTTKGLNNADAIALALTAYRGDL